MICRHMWPPGTLRHSQDFRPILGYVPAHYPSFRVTLPVFFRRVLIWFDDKRLVKPHSSESLTLWQEEHKRWANERVPSVGETKGNGHFVISIIFCHSIYFRPAFVLKSLDFQSSLSVPFLLKSFLIWIYFTNLCHRPDSVYKQQGIWLGRAKVPTRQCDERWRLKAHDHQLFPYFSSFRTTFWTEFTI